MLRIADALDRGHRGKIDDVEVEVGDSLQLTLRTREDASLETWTLERKAQLFREVFGMEVEAKVQTT